VAGSKPSFVGKWGSLGPGDGQFLNPEGVAFSPAGNVYVADSGNDRVQYFTPNGSFLGKWGSKGIGNGQFDCACDVAFSPAGNVLVTDGNNHRVQYFTPTGSYLGKWGKSGTGEGEFNKPGGVTVKGPRAYIIDRFNDRVQYFKDTEHAVAPASLGRVKALFR